MSKTSAPGLLFLKAERTRDTSVKLPDFIALSRRADDSILSLETLQAAISVGCRRILYPTGTTSETESSNWPWLGSTRLGARRHNVLPLSLLNGLRFHVNWAGRSSSNLYPHLAFRLSGGRHFLVTLCTAASEATPARKDCTQQPQIEACKFDQHTSFQVAVVGWSRRWRSSFIFFLHCYHFPLGGECV